MTQDRHSEDRTIDWLTAGQIEPLSRIIRSWNHVFLVRIDDGKRRGLAIYKPRAGEYPLWDFAHGTLALRETAAYRLSRALGWPRIPPTALRDGPFGFGMIQQFVEADVEANYFTLREDRLADLLPVALFDHLVNNTDRKGGHLLLDAEERIWAIDHALTFHAEPKLRTVIWDFAGAAIPDRYEEDLQRLRQALRAGQPVEQELAGLLSPAEKDALRERVDRLLALGHFPHPDPQRTHLPWPLV